MGNSDHGTTYMRVGGGDGELRPWHCIYVYSIETQRGGLALDADHDKQVTSPFLLSQVARLLLLSRANEYRGTSPIRKRPLP